MNRDFLLKIIIITAGAVLFLLLFLADKTNLNNPDEAPATQPTVTEAPAAVGSTPQRGLPPLDPDPALAAQIERLEALPGDQKVALLDSVIRQLEEMGRYAFAADYARARVSLDSTYEHALSAGVLSRRAMELDYLQSDTALVNRYSRMAVRMLEPVVQAQPENEDALLSLGLAYTRSVAPMQGILTVRKVVELNPANLEAQYRLGEFSLQTGQIDKAIERFETVLSLDERHYPAMFRLAIALAQADRSEEAKPYLQRVIAEAENPALQENARDLLSQLN